MSETIVKGYACLFENTRKGWLITDPDYAIRHLDSAGFWNTGVVLDSDYHPTEAAAREFALKHADSQAATGEAELPDKPGLWIRAANEWAWVMRGYGGDLFADAWYIAGEKKTVYLGTRPLGELPHWGWHPATNAPDLRAEVERLREELDQLRVRHAEVLSEVVNAGTMLNSLRDKDMPNDLAGAVSYLIDHSNEGWMRAANAERERAAFAAQESIDASAIHALTDERDTLRTQLASVERERDAYKLQLDRLAAHASAFESEAVKRLADAVGEP